MITKDMLVRVMSRIGRMHAVGTRAGHWLFSCQQMMLVRSCGVLLGL